MHILASRDHAIDKSPSLYSAVVSNHGWTGNAYAIPKPHLQRLDTSHHWCIAYIARTTMVTSFTASTIVYVERTTENSNCDILSNLDKPPKSLHPPRGNNNGASSTEEQATSSQQCPVKARRKHALSVCWPLRTCCCYLAMTGFLATGVHTANISSCPQQGKLQLCRCRCVQQIWQIRSEHGLMRRLVFC